ncbi:ER degradation-enhancing alpha-mannosidase-like protein [Elsinoe australis]|uniref:alpha-1,2-Mannosidase n=1 Tax=Elsinoe australis TaxID=40998 RepID=A0A4U7AXA8_9PEZI|nr:ER degradation-enhancing alpha-mannosidase-like protein [Elsinoe australis]
MPPSCHSQPRTALLLRCLLTFITALGIATTAHCMTDKERLTFRQSSRDIFYHGLSNYIRYAYPEDELRPLTCAPLTRDRANPAHIEVNDVLGNYSLSLVDSLSTLAILASTPRSEHDTNDALRDFQGYTALLVEEYGDGTAGRSGQGRRARGFDLDSKVQLFETTIRGLGGLLSAHLFAMGDLPIRGYKPHFEHWPETGRDGVEWDVYVTNGRDKFVYDGQLLRLAYDLGQRLLPAFHTPTGIPYPRVNLRTGIPFYENSPLNNDAEHGQCDPTETPKLEREITETCSAGAGSLVLEFTVLSRLTGDERFEQLAKKAFWAVWERRTSAGLIGSGIDAETGQWISPYTGIGAGIDSFFEYAFKSHILLSGLDTSARDPDEVSSSAFLSAWQSAHAAIKRHIYRGPQFQHPHYAQNDMWTGGPRLAWIDSLSAYYTGLLALAGEIEEATSAHLLYTALWNRYGALPERWNTFTGKIDAGLRWWGGRPEFIESTWYLYRATKDPWYLHVGEMTLKDIKRRCWTPCGWAGLQDVRTGEQSDRMESFFLGETAKYLYLLFDEDHPLNHLDSPYVFTTEGHPLIIPKHYRPLEYEFDADPVPSNPKCPAPPPAESFSISSVAARTDVFHAASLARLHETQATETQSFITDDMIDDPSAIQQKPVSPNNDTFYPWTLPLDLIPSHGTCSKMAHRQTFDLTFPALPNTVTDFGALQRIDKGILIKSVSGLRLALVLDDDPHHPSEQAYRIYALSNLALGRDEGIWLHPSVLSQLNPTDPNLTRLKDTEIIDLILDVPSPLATSPPITPEPPTEEFTSSLLSFFANPTLDFSTLSTSAKPADVLLSALPPVLLSSPHALADHLDSLASLSLPSLNLDVAFRAAASELRSSAQDPTQDSSKESNPSASRLQQPRQILRHTIPAFLPTGPGAATLPSATELTPDALTLPLGMLTFRHVLMLDSELCGATLSDHVPEEYEVLVIRRGGCSFSQKLARVPAYVPGDGRLKLVVVVSFPGNEDRGRRGDGHRQTGEEGMEKDNEFFVRPFLDEVQRTGSGVERRRPVPLVMVGGGEGTWGLFEGASSEVGVERGGEWWFEGRDREDVGMEVRGEEGEKGGSGGEKEERGKRKMDALGGGLSIKRRYWFASNGIRIANLHIA